MKVKALLSITCICLGALFASAKTITVKTADEFIQALGPDRTIVIDTQNPLMLTPAVQKLVDQEKIHKYDYYSSNNQFVGIGYYDNCDGPGLAVVGYANLTIESKQETGAIILSQPRYDDVLTFENCPNLKLNTVTFGHTDEGTCEGAVISLVRCSNVTVTRCNLFGCGTEGFIIRNSADINVENTTVHDCSYHSMHITNSDRVSFKSCGFVNNREFDQINISNCRNVKFTKCGFFDLKGPLFNVDSPTDFINCQFYNCEYNPSEMTIITDCTVTNDNPQADPAPAPAAAPVAAAGSNMLFGVWVYQDLNTVPEIVKIIRIFDDWTFEVCFSEGDYNDGGKPKIWNYYGKCWVAKKISDSEVILEYRIDTENSYIDGFEDKKKVTKGQLSVTRIFGGDSFLIVTPLEGLDFGLPKGKSLKFEYIDTED
ncbi:MAG: right-handed parallel beta-helix repeat-containing protein [Muribaculaceae bacterium]|nr:right-handed parallel beta-helix repeat-containing protein [Muribaculaceae bacterium]